MRRIALLLCLTVAASGCVGTHTQINQPVVNIPVFLRTNEQAYAVVVGVENGYAGYCAGATIDAEMWTMQAVAEGYETVTLLDEDATADAIEAAMLAAIAAAAPSGMVFFAYSGHGGQQPDSNGDEADGLDELICAYDRGLTDDRYGEILQTAQAGERVFAVLDSCHSGTMPRRARGLRVARDTEIHAQLIVYAGCSDADLSYGSEQGGEWTTALIDAGPDGQTYSGWFRAAEARMPEYQTPVYEEWGPVTDEYRQTRGMQ
jgi:hypothetical protein